MKRFKSYMKEDGHEDVASVKKQIKIAKSALEKMDGEMNKLNDSDSLPTWWTNKVFKPAWRRVQWSSKFAYEARRFSVACLTS